jgi:hypothetical protein
LTETLATKSELTGSAVVVLVTLSCHLSIAESFRWTGLVHYFLALAKTPSLAQKAGVFFRNVGEKPE